MDYMKDALQKRKGKGFEIAISVVPSTSIEGPDGEEDLDEGEVQELAAETKDQTGSPKTVTSEGVKIKDKKELSLAEQLKDAMKTGKDKPTYSLPDKKS